MGRAGVSTLGFAILGLLAGESLSGYDVKLRMAEPVGFFWQAGHSQIYPELAKLEAGGMVVHKAVPQSGKPDKKMYEITAEGLSAVKAWVSEPAKSAPTRDEATLKAYLSWLGEPGEMAAMFRELGRRHEKQMERYLETEAWMRSEWGEPERFGRRRFANYAALKRGVGFEREYAQWCRWVSEKLESSG
ncbi:MAG: PadR family transcriptional regulator [Actinomycetota bacterium]|jgi:DNA-binding PadR family transcriptional regulator|nr:PadR family transcriptional regulator [Actinomycetota bacterium]